MVAAAIAGRDDEAKLGTSAAKEGFALALHVGRLQKLPKISADSAPDTRHGRHLARLTAPDSTARKNAAFAVSPAKASPNYELRDFNSAARRDAAIAISRATVQTWWLGRWERAHPPPCAAIVLAISRSNLLCLSFAHGGKPRLDMVISPNLTPRLKRTEGTCLV